MLTVTEQAAKKIVVTSVPFTDTTSPVMAPGLFKGILTTAGFDCTAIDLNGEVINRICNDVDYAEYLRFFYYSTVTPGVELKLKEIFDYMANRLIQYNPDIICLSLLHYQCQHSTMWLSFFIKKLRPDIKIVIGGAGAFGSGLTTNDNSYISMLKNQNLIDYYISGDGDIALVELLKGNIDYPGINKLSWTPIEDLNSIPYPNYDDYNFDIYKSPFIGVLGSRGCVRQCTFCDIHEYWEKFNWRTGENIFNEMLEQNKKYSIRYFKFQDSLINGNVKEYNKLITLLANHNKQNPDNTLNWASYFILRPATQMSEEQWKLTAESGAFRLNVGIESLIEKNRTHIKKKFSNADIEYGLEMAKKYNIPLTFILLVGYVTETGEDHIETLKWLEEHKHYANNPIAVLTIGGTLAILPGTWLERNQTKLGVSWNVDGQMSATSGNNQFWEIKSTGNNYKTRVSRLDDIIKVGTSHGYNVVYSVIDPQKELEDVINKEMANANYSF
tara:strand:+ start:37 stop:1536 length:1500 start_codon:yes stop_codon:yes gene_type:complete